MDFSSLVLMEIDKDSKLFIKELGSYEVGEGAEYITKMYYDGIKVNVFFDTNKDVEEWEYTAIFDLFKEEVFSTKGFEIEDVDSEYNPTWKVTFHYVDDHMMMEEKLKELCYIIDQEMDKVFKDIKNKEEEYK